MQSAGSTARLLGPLVAGFLLTMDLQKPVQYYGETPFYAAAILSVIGAALAFCLKKPAADRLPETIPVGSGNVSSAKPWRSSERSKAATRR